MRAVIVSGGNPPSKGLLFSYLKEGDFVVGVDKGCDALYKYKIMPDLILGDFDSANKDVIEYFILNNVKNLKFNFDKDYTDTDLGFRKAIENGADEILLFGATGTRMDHFLGNLGILLKSLKDNIKMKIIDDNNIMYLIDKPTRISGENGRTISFHAISDTVKNLSIKGARYKLNNYDMSLLEPRAICNEFIDKDIEISFDSGIILVILPKD